MAPPYSRFFQGAHCFLAYHLGCSLCPFCLNYCNNFLFKTQRHTVGPSSVTSTAREWVTQRGLRTDRVLSPSWRVQAALPVQWTPLHGVWYSAGLPLLPWGPLNRITWGRIKSSEGRGRDVSRQGHVGEGEAGVTGREEVSRRVWNIKEEGLHPQPGMARNA